MSGVILAGGRDWLQLLGSKIQGSYRLCDPYTAVGGGQKAQVVGSCNPWGNPLWPSQYSTRLSCRDSETTTSAFACKGFKTHFGFCRRRDVSFIGAQLSGFEAIEKIKCAVFAIQRSRKWLVRGLGEICSCCCLTVLLGPAWVLLSKIYIPLCSPLYEGKYI